MATNVQQRSVTTEPDTAVSARVVNAISAATGTPVDALPPLYHVIDPEALDALFSGYDTAGSVEFQYAGWTVTVLTDRRIDFSAGSARSDTSVDS